MSQLGELCLWAAPGLLGLAAAASLAGAWADRSDLSTLGGRAALGGAALLLLAALGLGSALTGVDLRYVYVANHSGHSLPVQWRAAALWSGAAGGVLMMTLLLAIAAALSDRRSSRTRHVAARTGVLAVLALGGALLTLAAARPFAPVPHPPAGGMGLPLAMRDPVWHAQLWAGYAAAALTAFAFADIVAEQLLESNDDRGTGRRAIGVAGGLLVLIALAGAWRSYSLSGEMLGGGARAHAGAAVPALLLVLAYLHAPPAPLGPPGSDRWRAGLSVAAFPATAGLAAALLGGAAGAPVVPMWAGGLIVGLLCGALAGLAPARLPRLPRSGGLPGFGRDAIGAGLLLLVAAGLAGVAVLLPGTWDRELGLYGLLVMLTPAGLWMIVRRARGLRVWPAALASCVAGAAGAAALSGPQVGPTLAGAVVGLAAAGGVADLLRVRAAGASAGRSDARASSVRRARSGRRLASTAGHVGLALVVLGLWGEMLGQTLERRIQPGSELALDAGPVGSVSVRYLGLSRYRTAGMQKFVASFHGSGSAGSELLVAETGWEWSTGREVQRPAIDRGLFRDVLVGIADLALAADEDEIIARVSLRPGANLVWAGGLVLAFALIGMGGLPMSIESAGGRT